MVIYFQNVAFISKLEGIVSEPTGVEAPIGEVSVTDPYLCSLGVCDTASTNDLERSFNPLLCESKFAHRDFRFRFL